MKDNILIIDAHNMMWRANMSWGKDKQDNKSENVMIYNFFRNLRPLVEMFSPSKIFMVLEGSPKHRYEIYADYKANRIVKTASKQETFDQFHVNKKEILRLLKHLPITLCKSKNYEADDVISTLCDNLKDESVTIISNDSDYIQLLQRGYSNLKIYNPMRKVFQQAPSYHYLAWKSLRGDSSDNIPGLMSDAKAEKLVSNPKLFEDWMSVEENRSLFSINKSLIEFAVVPEEEIEIEEGEKNFALLRSEFQKMEFESLTKISTWEKFCNTFKCVKF
jgi:5'-3' exonuclease